MTATSSRGLTSLRAANRRLIVDRLQRQGEISRAALARHTGLSGTTVSSLIAELEAEGLVAETGADDRGTGRTGRPARLLRFVPPRTLVAGLELGHASIRVAVSDLAGQVKVEQAIDFDVDDAGPGALDRAAELLGDAIDAGGIGWQDIGRLVLGIPGYVDPQSGTVVSGRMRNWAHLVPAEILTAKTGLPTTTENDADLSAVGEQMFGAAKGLQDVVYVKVSSGIGAGLVLGGRLHRAAEGGTGEIGHVQVSESGSICTCGNRGCLETIASVPQAIEVLREVHADALSAADLDRLTRAGDRATVRVLTDMGREIGRAVADLCNLLAPQAVVFGGDIDEALEPLVDAVRRSVERYTQPRTAARVRIVRTSLGHRAGVLGAVATAIDSHPLLVG
ncbi:ROK family transcriptional regulator [Nakamurella lactea]|uniref:ROK family transcriptional regulator n=1 Tax=Nakamurella lactea TaxID=459515 RepID=UPI00055B4BE9|nr:ROK family transcriptional regulator [Nakamurella lactea]